jgi:hypothetical protein
MAFRCPFSVFFFEGVFIFLLIYWNRYILQRLQHKQRQNCLYRIMP